MMDLKSGRSYIAKNEFYIQNIIKKNSFDFLEIDAKDTSIENIRSLLRLASQKPMDNQKYFLVRNAEKLTIQMQNTLLKLLEEPPSYLVIIIVTHNPTYLLDTLRSRLLPLDTYKHSEVIRPNLDKLPEDYLESSLPVEQLINSIRDKEEFLRYLENKQQLLLTAFINNNNDAKQEYFSLLQRAFIRLNLNCNWKIVAQWLILRWRII